jgi:hypothetical protein
MQPTSTGYLQSTTNRACFDERRGRLPALQPAFPTPPFFFIIIRLTPPHHGHHTTATTATSSFECEAARPIPSSFALRHDFSIDSSFLLSPLPPNHPPHSQASAARVTSTSSRDSPHHLSSTLSDCFCYSRQRPSKTTSHPPRIPLASFRHPYHHYHPRAWIGIITAWAWPKTLYLPQRLLLS